jgi:hypothetical protein
MIFSSNCRVRSKVGVRPIRPSGEGDLLDDAREAWLRAICDLDYELRIDRTDNGEM